MRYISFSMTTEQFNARAKDVTRRNGWWKATDGQILMGAQKCMGLKPGEKIVPLHSIKLVMPRLEPLSAMLDDKDYGRDECRREGFPDWTPEQFIDFFIKGHSGVMIDKPIMRLEFIHLEQGQG